MNKKNLLLILIIFGIFIFAGILKNNILFFNKVIVVTDKKEYKIAEPLKIKIENNLKETICFSSCYPYKFEKKNLNKEWEEYLYIKCEKEDIAKDCIEPQKIKTFELLPEKEKSFHRLHLSACIGCKSGEKFREDEIFYSNEFSIK